MLVIVDYCSGCLVRWKTFSEILRYFRFGSSSNFRYKIDKYIVNIQVNQQGVPSFDPNGMMFSTQAARDFAAAGEQQSEWLQMQLGGNFERTA